MFNSMQINNIKQIKADIQKNFEDSFPSPTQLNIHYVKNQTWLKPETIQSYLTDHLRQFYYQEGLFKPEPKNYAVDIERLTNIIEDIQHTSQNSREILNEEGVLLYMHLEDNITLLKSKLLEKQKLQKEFLEYQDMKNSNKYKIVFQDTFQL